MNPITHVVQGLADYLRRHVPAGGVVYAAPPGAWPATGHLRVMLADPWLEPRPGTGRGWVECYAQVMARIPDIVPEAAERTVEQVLWEIAEMWHAVDSGTLGGVCGYALPGATTVEYGLVDDDEAVWDVITHDITIGLTSPAATEEE